MMIAEGSISKGFMGNLIGSKSNNPTEKMCKSMMLEKNHLYRFCLWTNEEETFGFSPLHLM